MVIAEPSDILQQQRSKTRTNPMRWLLLVAVTIVLIMSGQILRAEDADAPSPPEESASEPPAQDTDKARDRKEKSAIVAGFLFLLLVIVSVSAVALLVIWGRRTRRLARQPLPKTSELDPMWYLRKPTPSPPESNPDNSPAQEPEH